MSIFVFKAWNFSQNHACNLCVTKNKFWTITSTENLSKHLFANDKNEFYQRFLQKFMQNSARGFFSFLECKNKKSQSLKELSFGILIVICLYASNSNSMNINNLQIWIRKYQLLKLTSCETVLCCLSLAWRKRKQHTCLK